MHLRFPFLLLLCLGMVQMSCAEIKKWFDISRNGHKTGAEIKGKGASDEGTVLKNELMTAFQQLNGCEFKDLIKDPQKCQTAKSLIALLRKTREKKPIESYNSILLNLLQNTDEKIRWMATRELSWTVNHKAVLSGLKKAFSQEKSPTVKMEMFEVIRSCQLLKKGVANFLVKTLTTDPAEEFQKLALLSLDDTLAANYPKLGDTLKDRVKNSPNRFIRGNSCRLLGQFKITDSIALISSYLKDPDLQEQCAVGLALNGTEIAQEKLRSEIEAGFATAKIATYLLDPLWTFQKQQFFKKGPQIIALFERIILNNLGKKEDREKLVKWLIELQKTEKSAKESLIKLLYFVGYDLRPMIEKGLQAK